MEQISTLNLEIEPRYVHAQPANGGFQPPADSMDDPDSGGLIEYWRTLRRHRGTIILIAFVGLVAAILISLPQTPIYRARTSVEIQDVNNDFLNTRQVNPVSEGGNAFNTLTDVQTQMKILQSENLVDRVITGLKSEHKLAPLEPRTDTLAAQAMQTIVQTLKLPPPTQAELDYKLHLKAMKALKVRQLGQTRIVELYFDSKDPAFAADFANRLTTEFVESNMEARWKMTQHTGEWLSRQLDDMRISLERSEDNLQAYARKAGLLFTTTNDSDRTNVSEDKLRQVQEELSKAQADRVSAQSKYEIAKAAAPDTLADVLNDASLRTLQQRITELRQQEADLSIIYTPKSEKIQRILSQIGPLQQALERERTDILDRIHHDYESAMRREQLLLSDYANQSHVVTDQAEKTVQYNILKREVDSNRQIYEAMLQQVKQASVASAMRASNVRTVDPAKVPTKQYSPDYLINSALGLLSGCLLGVGFVIMRERSNKTIQQPGDMPFWLNVPELGVIPSATMETRRRIAYAKPKQIDGSVAANGNGSKRHGDKTQDVALVTHNSKPSLIAESFRAVLTSILFSGDNGTRPRVLMLTSASPVEGKTTLVSNLGIAMAEIGRKVLIIDADLRRPRMHVLFELPNETGLSTLLQDRTFSDESLNGIIHETAIPGLSVLPAGPSTHAAANLLYSTVFPEMLTLLRKQFDTVIIDTPPMLQMTDARVVGRLADAVILVTRAGKTTREAAMAAYQRFAEDKTRVLGTILNDWNPKTAPGGYYGYYNGYGHSYKNYNGYYTAGSKN